MSDKKIQHIDVQDAKRKYREDVGMSAAIPAPASPEYQALTQKVQRSAANSHNGIALRPSQRHPGTALNGETSLEGTTHSAGQTLSGRLA